jgi:hypothetical protein
MSRRHAVPCEDILGRPDKKLEPVALGQGSEPLGARFVRGENTDIHRHESETGHDLVDDRPPSQGEEGLAR